jgi:hypothetical protein
LREDTVSDSGLHERRADLVLVGEVAMRDPSLVARLAVLL